MSTRQDKSLHDACGKGQLRKVREILQKNSDIANTLDLRLGFLGYTPLHEAACQGHADILQLLLIYGGNVDAKANGQYTPLHIAASMDYVKCIKVLLKNGANIKAVDDFNKTPYQTAIQHKRKESAKCLKSAEIIREAGNDPQELNILLNETSPKDITATCFDDALVEACRRGKFEAVCMLLVAGAKKIKESICISMQNGYYRISALLLLCYAALKGDVDMLEMLLDKSLECHDWLQQFIDQSVPIGTVVELIRESLKNVEDYTSVVIKLPGLENQVTVLKDLLINTSCRIKEKKVNWSKLSLITIDESWLAHIKTWVQNLNLSKNKLTSLPECLLDLKMVVSLNLSENRLKVAPMLLFSLVSLRDLNLSGNGIAELPDVPQWRPILKSLNISNNLLSYLPASIAKSCLETLNLSQNNFTRVPLSVCEILSLRSLNMSDNREISFLPNEMGKLRNLTSINLKNLDQITDPPQHVRQNAQDLVATLRRKLRNCEPYYTMKLMLVGKGGQGKTTLVHRLRDDFTFNENDLTQGVEVSDLVIRRGAFEKDFTFKVWDFGGQEDYYVTHQCFLSTMSLYLLVWRLIDGEEGVNGLIPWLDNIAVRSPNSTVIIVGTHLDCISPDKLNSGYVTEMEQMIRELVDKPRYRNKIIIHPDGICAVSCAFGGSRSEINKLRLIIYNTAGNLKKGRTRVMGELIPSSFISLIDRIEKRKIEIQQQHELPIIRKEEFDAMVKENSLHSRRDIQEPMDVMDATIFLRERGVVMHFDDPNEGLSDLYFIEPRWLCALMARVITIKGHADLVKDGVLEVQETKYLFRNDLPFDFYEQYLRLLVRFQIAYLLDASRVLVPSKLPEEEPEVVAKLKLPYAPVRRIYKINFQWIHGFWPRFMSRFFFYVKEMIAVDATRYQKAKDREHGYFGHFCSSCLRVDTDSTKTFPCFMDSTEWETRTKSERSEKILRGSSQSNDPSTKETPQKDYPTTEDPSTEESIKDDSLTNNSNTAKNKSSRKTPSRKLPWRRDASKRESSKKESSKKESSKKESSKKKSLKKDSTKKEPMKIEFFREEGDFCDNRSMPDQTMLGDDLQSLLLNPSVKIFSDEELRDDTDGDRIVINQVDTAMDYSRRTDSFHDKKTESVKRVGMNLRIASYDGSPQKSPAASEEITQGSDSSEKSNKSKNSRKLSGKEEVNKQNSKSDSSLTKESEVFPRANQGDWSSSEVSNTTDGFPITKDDQPKRSEDASNSIEPVSTKGAQISEQNLSGDEDQPRFDKEHTTSDQILEDEPVKINQVDITVDGDLIDNIDHKSETMEIEKVGMKIPTVNSLESDDNKSFLSCSDVCSLSSWMETKGLPSFITSSKSNENEPFIETRNDDNVALATASLSSNNSQESFSEKDVISSPQDRYNFPQNQAISHVSETSCKMETQHERSRNSVSQSISTSSSVRSDEPTDTDCEVYSESISSTSNTNISNPLAVTNHPEKIAQNLKGTIMNLNHNGDQSPDDVFANLCDVTDSGVKVQSTDHVSEKFEGFSLQSEAVGVQSDGGIHSSENGGKEWEVSRAQSVNVVDLPKSENKQPGDDSQQSGDVGEQSGDVGEQSGDVGGQSGDVGEQSGDVGEQSGDVGEQSGDVGEQSGDVGEQSGDVGEHDFVAVNGDVCTETVVETQKCTLCKENVAINELVAIPLDVAGLIEQKLIHCWRSGVCLSYLGVFLAVAYRPLSDSIVVEIAASPNPLGRRLLTFVVDHLDTLIKEWYPGLEIPYGAEPTVQKLIPCRTCEKNGNQRPHMLTFDSCVTQYSMGNFVKCPEHEVNIQDVAPDVVLQDIDADLLLEEDEIEYERSEANVVGTGVSGKVYSGRCRQKDAAIKEYSSVSSEEDAMARYCEVRKEVNILRRLGQHPFLVNLIGVCLRPFRLVLELALEGSLADTLFNSEFQIERIVIFRMLYQIADAMSYLHSLSIIYRDLKPQNVLVMSYKEEADVNIKLTDFGTAAFQFNEGLHDLVGTPGYHAPEMLKEFRERAGYNDKVDVFALGILMSGFITRRQPFFSCSSTAQINDMTINGRWPEYKDITRSRIGFAGLTWLMESCLAYEPSMRHPCSNIAEQLRSTSFQLFLGIIALPCPQSVRHVCFVHSTVELWVAVDDKVETHIFVYELRNWCLKKSFSIVCKDGRSLCLQANCMHVNATDVLIGLRGDQDIVAIYDAESYKLKTRITLEEPVFSLSSNDFYIYLGMSSGICLVANRTKPILSIELSHSEPVTCVTTVGDEYLWFAAGKCLQIFHAEGNEKTPVYELNAVRFNASSAPFSQTVLSESNIWCISKGDSIVTAWNVNTRQKSLEIDCKSFLGPEYDLLESAVICVLPVLDTVWIGMGGGKLLIVDADSGELITSFKLFDDHVRTLTLVPGPGPCGTEKYYVVVSGRNVLETALSRESRGKHVCRLTSDVIKTAPNVQITPVKSFDKGGRSLRGPFGRAKSPLSDTTKSSDVPDAEINNPQGGVLVFFEAISAEALRRTESK